MKKSLNILYNVAFYSFIVVVIAFSIVSFKASDYKGVKKIGDFAFCNVLTGSMSPTINPGSLIVIKEMDDNQAKVDDIVTFVGENTNSVVTHRIVEINNDGEYYITKGDANDAVDSFFVNDEMIVGKVIFIAPYIGKIIMFIQENIFMVLIAITLVIVLMELFKSEAKGKEVNGNVEK